MSRHSASTWRRLRRLLLLTILLWPLAAGAESPEAAYDAGVAAFEAGWYAQAVEQFLTARARGLEDARVHYNLASAWYRLGDFRQAYAAFSEAAKTPEIASLAWYNLGLTAAQQGDVDLARIWFLRVLETDDQDTLHALAVGMLDRLGDEPAFPPDDAGTTAAPPNWNGFLLGTLGYDSNVLLVSDSDLFGVSDLDDFFIDLFGYAERDVWNDDSGGYSVEVDASAWLLRHARLDEFDMDAVRAGATIAHAGTSWIIGGGAHGAWTLLNSRGYTRESLFSLRAARLLSPGLLRMRYELGRIDAIREDYRYLEGSRHRLETRMSRMEDNARFHLYYQFEYNDRTDIDAPRFISASPVRNTLGMGADIPLTPSLELSTELRVMHSRYRDPNELAGDERVTRVDQRLSISGGLAWKLPADAELSLEYRYAVNNSTIPVYEYSRYRVMAGILIVF